jgi:hypothetical protein
LQNGGFRMGDEIHNPKATGSGEPEQHADSVAAPEKLETISFSSNDNVLYPPGAEIILVVIPGIRTNAEWTVDWPWTQAALSRNVRFFVAMPSHHLNEFDLIFGWRNSKLVKELREQLEHLREQNPATPISIVAHSLGTELFARASKDMSVSFDWIFFIGAVCHRKHAPRLHKACRCFVNDRGRRDPWPFWAEIFCKRRYSATGTFGFRQTYIEFERRFDYDHMTCTSIEHLEKWVLPSIYGDYRVPTPKESPSEHYSRNWVLALSTIWRMLVALLIFDLAGPWLLPFYPYQSFLVGALAELPF